MFPKGGSDFHYKGGIGKIGTYLKKWVPYHLFLY